MLHSKKIALLKTSVAILEQICNLLSHLLKMIKTELITNITFWLVLLYANQN